MDYERVLAASTADRQRASVGRGGPAGKARPGAGRGRIRVRDADAGDAPPGARARRRGADAARRLRLEPAFRPRRLAAALVRPAASGGGGRKRGAAAAEQGALLVAGSAPARPLGVPDHRGGRGLPGARHVPVRLVRPVARPAADWRPGRRRMRDRRRRPAARFARRIRPAARRQPLGAAFRARELRAERDPRRRRGERRAFRRRRRPGSDHRESALPGRSPAPRIPGWRGRPRNRALAAHRA